MEFLEILKIHGTLRRYCTSSLVSRYAQHSRLGAIPPHGGDEVQYLLTVSYIFNITLDSMVYLPITSVHKNQHSEGAYT